MRPFRRGNDTEQYSQNTSFEKVIRLYEFDRRLRILVWEAIEIIENALRCQIAYILSHRYGSHWHTKPEIFSKLPNGKNKSKTVDIVSDIAKQLNTKMACSEDYISAYKKKYSSPKLPPSWAAVNVLTFTNLSMICKCLRDEEDQQRIASVFLLDTEVFLSWLHSLSYLRNLCAHHMRLWDRRLSIQGMEYKHDGSGGGLWLSPAGAKVNKWAIYYHLCILNYFLQSLDRAEWFSAQFASLVDEYKSVIRFGKMGMPKNWGEEALWKKRN